jgi:hypothetical protein
VGGSGRAGAPGARGRGKAEVGGGVRRGAAGWGWGGSGGAPRMRRQRAAAPPPSAAPNQAVRPAFMASPRRYALPAPRAMCHA